MAILISEPPGNLFRTRTLRVGQSYRLTFCKADTLLKTGTWTVTQPYHPSQREKRALVIFHKIFGKH